jgi:outer membrane receptor protein involved in Fe transport
VGGRYHFKNVFFVDADATFSQAQFRDEQGEVPLAPRVTFSAGFGARKQIGSFTPFGAVRFKAITDRPANEAGSLTAGGFAIVNANAGVRWKNIEAAVDVQNLFNSKWREVTFATESRLQNEMNPVTGIHYTPGWPITVMGRATVYW